MGGPQPEPRHSWAPREGYRAEAIKGWFRVLRTMTRDAMEPLDLPRDPTLRITCPEDEERENNALTPQTLAPFLKRLSGTWNGEAAM